MNTYRGLLRETLTIISGKKITWILAIIIAIAGFKPSLQSIAVILSNFQHLDLNTPGNAGNAKQQLQTIFTFITTNDFGPVAKFLLTALFFAGCLLILLWISLVARAVLIYLVSPRNKKATIKEAFNKGVRHFWRILGLDIIATGLLTPFLYLSGMSFDNITNIYLQAFVAMSLLLLSLVIIFLLGLIYLYTLQNIVLHEKSLITSIKESSVIFAKNILASLESTVLIFVAKTLFFFFGFLAFGILMLPLIMLIWVFKDQHAILSQILFTILFTLFILYSLFSISIAVSYELTYWTLFFENLQKQSFTSKLQRMFNRN